MHRDESMDGTGKRHVVHVQLTQCKQTAVIFQKCQQSAVTFQKCKQTAVKTRLDMGHVPDGECSFQRSHKLRWVFRHILGN